jgi:hypothetical protein
LTGRKWQNRQFRMRWLPDRALSQDCPSATQAAFCFGKVGCGLNLSHSTFFQSETWDTHIYQLDNKITVNGTQCIRMSTK